MLIVAVSWFHSHRIEAKLHANKIMAASSVNARTAERSTLHQPKHVGQPRVTECGGLHTSATHKPYGPVEPAARTIRGAAAARASTAVPLAHLPLHRGSSSSGKS